METITASQPPVFTKEFRSVCRDILSQAINEEIVGMSNFAKLTGTIDDVHRSKKYQQLYLLSFRN